MVLVPQNEPTSFICAILFLFFTRFDYFLPVFSFKKSVRSTSRRKTLYFPLKFTGYFLTSSYYPLYDNPERPSLTFDLVDIDAGETFSTRVYPDIVTLPTESET